MRVCLVRDQVADAIKNLSSLVDEEFNSRDFGDLDFTPTEVLKAIEFLSGIHLEIKNRKGI